MAIDTINCIIKSQSSNEFIMHSDKMDMRIKCNRRDSFLDLLKLRFAHMKPDITLKVFAVVRCKIL